MKTSVSKFLQKGGFPEPGPPVITWRFRFVICSLVLIQARWKVQLKTAISQVLREAPMPHSPELYPEAREAS
jgi:hypothetical protein